LGFVAGQTDNEAGSFVVTASNNKINFKVGVVVTELTATLTADTYVMGASSSEPGTLCAHIKTQMQAADVGGVYTVTFDTVLRKVTITRSTSTFKLLWVTGTNGTAGTNTSAYTLLGFTALDTSSAISITSDSQTTAPTWAAGNEIIKEIRITGSSSAVGVAGDVVAAEIVFVYDQSENLVQVVSRIGNGIQTTNIIYNTDSTIKTIQEIVS
jgi:hypothetical protein